MNLVEENTSYQKVNEKVGKRKNVLLKKFHLCSFCKEAFVKNHQQLKDHIKTFHKIDEEDFQIKSNELIEYYKLNYDKLNIKNCSALL